jgi:hypothetical protein
VSLSCFPVFILFSCLFSSCFHSFNCIRSPNRTRSTRTRSPKLCSSLLMRCAQCEALIAERNAYRVIEALHASAPHPQRMPVRRLRRRACVDCTHTTHMPHCTMSHHVTPMSSMYAGTRRAAHVRSTSSAPACVRLYTHHTCLHCSMSPCHTMSSCIGTIHAYHTCRDPESRARALHLLSACLRGGCGPVVQGMGPQQWTALLDIYRAEVGA